MTCSLWEEYSDQMFEYIKQNEDEVHVVLIVQFGSFSNYKGMLYITFFTNSDYIFLYTGICFTCFNIFFYKGNVSVQNAFFITRLFINEDIEDIRSFKKRYHSYLFLCFIYMFSVL